MKKLLSLIIISVGFIFAPAIHVFATSNPYLDMEIAQPFGGKNAHGTFAWEQDRDIWLKKKSTKRKVIKKRAQIKKLAKKTKPKATKTYTPKKKTVYSRTKEYVKKKYTAIKKAVTPKKVQAKELKAVAPATMAPTAAPAPELKNEIEEPATAPIIDYDPTQDETPLMYNEEGGVIKPRGLTLWERVKKFFGVKPKQSKIFTPSNNAPVEVTENIPPPVLKPKGVAVPEAPPNSCKRFVWNVPDNIVGVVLEVRDPNGNLTRQITISNYISIKPEQTFELIPKCRS